MKKYKGRFLSFALAAVMVVTCVIPGIALAAEPAEADTSAEAFAVAAEAGPVEGTEAEGTARAEGSEAEEAEEAAPAEGSEAEEAEEAAEDEDNEVSGPHGDPEDGEAHVEDSNGEEIAPEERSSEESTEAAPSESEEAEADAEAGETAAPAELEQQAGIAGGHKTDSIPIVDSPAFNAEKKVGKYVVKIHAEEGVLPKSTKVSVTEMKEAEAEPYAEKAEQMADAGIAVAVIDITFTDSMGREIQPNGMVEVTFANAVEENSTMSVYHAPEGDASKMEEVRSEEKGDVVTFKMDSFSPVVLLAAADEPNWTKGGAGTLTDVTGKVTFTLKEQQFYRYDTRGLGDWLTMTYNMYVDSKYVGRSFCLDPRLDGQNFSRSDKTYEVTAPMLRKAAWYGQYGPGSIISSITGTDDEGTNNIVTHVSISEIYARLGYTSKSSVGDGFLETSNTLRDHVKRFVKAIEDKADPPGDYYLYVAVSSDSRKQDFGFGSYELVDHDASFTIRKAPDDDSRTVRDMITGNSNYDLTGAVYCVYRSEEDARADRNRVADTVTKKTTITITGMADTDGKGVKGISDPFHVEPGSYYIKEIKAPVKGGYLLSESITPVRLSSDEDAAVSVSDTYKFVYLRIKKEPRNVPEGVTPPSLAGAVFNIYSDAKCESGSLVGTVTTDERGYTEQLKVDTKGHKLLIQNYYAKEIKAPAGYRKVDSRLTIETSSALKDPVRYALIDRTVSEPLTRAGITIIKESGNTDITDDNSCYPSLSGAKFGIYRDETCRDLVETIVTDEDGFAESGSSLTVGNYWIRELEAPYGYRINGEIFPVTSQEIASGTQELTVSDEPALDPAQITIEKRAKGDVKGNSLEGAEFTFSYYDGYYKSESELPEKPLRSWTVRTKETGGHYVARLYDCKENGTFVSGDEFYTDMKGKPAFPLGTVTISETRAPEGYKNDPDFGGGSKILIGNVVLNSAGDAKFTVVLGTEPAENTITVEETPHMPSIRTSALDAQSRSHTAFAGEGTIRIIDTVTYEDLNKNTSYTMYGTLMDKSTGEPFKDEAGKEIKASAQFNTGGKMNGTVDVVFEFTCSEDHIKGHVLVVKEELRADASNEDADKIPGAVHWDPEDREQTIRFPEIGTYLKDKATGEQVVPADSDVELVDTVSYKSLMPGEDYVVTGTLMEKATGKPLQYKGSNVTSAVSFTAKESDGTVEVTYRFHTEGLSGKSIVAFERLASGGRIVAKHEDIDDSGQTVTIPGIETDAYDGENGKKNTLAAGERTIVDKVAYTGLVPGKTYEISGEIKVRPSDTGISFDDARTVPAEIVSAKGDGSISFDSDKVTFVPAGNEGETVSGILSIGFKLDASDLAGEVIVVGETLRQNGVEIAVHRDINDERQSDKIPDGQTVAIDTSTGIKNTLASDNRVLKDTFRYENLIPGETYRFTGKVIAGALSEADTEDPGDGGSGEERTDLLEEIHSVMTDENGIPVGNGYVEFVPDKEDGTVDLYFSIDASELAGRDVTVFEKVTLGGKPVIVHEVLDGTQTVYIPEGKTTAVDSETKEQISMPDEEVRIIDTMVYRNLIPGKEYTVKGRVMRKNTGSEIASVLAGAAFAEGSAGIISVADNAAVFTPEQEDGALALTFDLDASGLAGEDIVMFERVYHNGAEVIVHENIDDTSQTIHFPNGHTFASDPDTGVSTMKAGQKVIVMDEFVYENLLPGKDYAITGKVMLKPLNGEGTKELPAKMVSSEGDPIGEHVFSPGSKDGSEKIRFEVDATGLEGRSIVMFETLEYIDQEFGIRTAIVIHEDINDEDQTLNFPEVRTTATDKKDGDHEIACKGNVTVSDNVEYRNLTPGAKYRVSGILMNRSTGETAKAGGKEITGEAVFTAKQKNGTVKVNFTFDSSKLKEGDYVVLETLYEINAQTGDGNIVGSHCDLKDASQTVRRPSTPKPQGNPATGDNSDPAVWLAAAMASVIGIAAAVCFGRKRFRK